MLKKVGVASLRVGMFVSRVEGSWVDHGLWRNTFMIANEERLLAVLRSGAKEFWIDTAKGTDSAPAVAAPSPPIVANHQAPEVISTQTDDDDRSASMADEMVRAKAVVGRAKAIVTATFADVRVGKNPNLEAVEPVVDDIMASVLRNSSALISLARLKTPDEYTYLHSVAVCALMVALGRNLGFDASQCRAAGLAGLLHDMGKARMPQKILHKPGKLTQQEFLVMQSHPRAGHALLVASGIRGPGSEEALDVCLHHHEKVDGTGYPNKLAGDHLSLLARMGAVCDVYDAVTSSRPYKSAWDPSGALAQMASWTGHFDRAVLAALVKTVGLYPPGSLVRLASERIAVVTQCNANPMKPPVVKVVFSIRSQLRVAPEMLDLGHPRARDRIIAREPRDHWNFPDVNEL